MKTIIYLVEFNQYVDKLKTSVYSKKYNKYLDVDKKGFLVREEHLDYISEYGEGILSKKPIGELFELPVPDYSSFYKE